MALSDVLIEPSLENRNSSLQEAISRANFLFSDVKNSNLIIDLLQGLLSDDDNDVLTALDCIQKVFCEILKTSDILDKRVKNSDVEVVDEYKEWLREQFFEAKTQFTALLTHPNKLVRQSAAENSLLLIVTENDKRAGPGNTPSGFLKKVVVHLLSAEYDMKQPIAAFTDSTLEEGLKLQILEAVYAALRRREKQAVNDTFLLNAYACLKVNWLPKKVPVQSTNNNGYMKSMKTRYTETWVEFLKFQVPMTIFKRVLVDLHEKVLPNMKNPLILTDFLTDSYNFGGAISLLALNGLFFLIQRCNLEYPNFFEKLYILLTEDIFHAKYRPQFFYLMDVFFSSLHVPAYLIGAFVKKLSRLSLVAPPDVILIILPFLRNLLVRHQSVRVLINRNDVNEVSSDPYLSEENCLSKCKAMESSLWEIKTLQQHWHPSVAKEACFINKTLPSIEKDMSEFLETNYTELFNQEAELQTKDLPLSYDVPSGLFSRSEDKMHSWWSS